MMLCESKVHAIANIYASHLSARKDICKMIGNNTLIVREHDFVEAPFTQIGPYIESPLPAGTLLHQYCDRGCGHTG